MWREEVEYGGKRRTFAASNSTQHAGNTSSSPGFSRTRETEEPKRLRTWDSVKQSDLPKGGTAIKAITESSSFRPFRTD
jgi:hypothetical protein